jgi:hypothetical protein
VGSLVILVNGALGAYISRGARQVQVFLPEDEPARSTTARAVAGRLATLARDAGLLVADVNGVTTAEHPIAPFLVNAGFHASPMGFMVRRAAAGRGPQRHGAAGDAEASEPGDGMGESHAAPGAAGDDGETARRPLRTSRSHARLAGYGAKRGGGRGA